MNFITALFLVLTHDIWGTCVHSQIITSLKSGSMRVPILQRGVNFPGKIVGGFPASTGQFRYQLSLRRNGDHYCGASLVQVNDIFLAITAAHCVDSRFHPESYLLVGGDVNIADTSGHGQTRKIKKIVIHEEYGVFNTKATFNDIALLFLDEPFEIDDSVDVIDLPDYNQETDGMLTVSGWGTLYSGGDIPDILHYVEIPVVSHDVCLNKWTNHPCLPFEIGDDILCAGVDDGEKSACNGDSGGPATSKKGGYLAGIVSFGDPSCGQSEYPGGFTKVAFYVKWINEQVSLFKRAAQSKY